MNPAPWGHSLTEWMLSAGAELHWEQGALPVTVTSEQKPLAACYITSPKIAWFDYAADELQGSFILKMSLKAFSHLANWIGMSKNAIVGNFPISTNVWESVKDPAICEASRSLILKKLKRYLFVRNLLSHQHGSLLTELQSMGFVALPARVIYEFDLRMGAQSKPSHLARDLSALKKSLLKVSSLDTIDDLQAERMQALYELIYIKKHSAFNANYTPAFFKDMINSKWMSCLSLMSEEGEMVAFALLHQVGDTLTVPALGYWESPTGPGIYRLLFASIYNYTLERQLLLNYSSGAGDFKRKRGARGRLEYTAVKAPSSFLDWKSRLLSWIGKKTEHLTEDDLIRWGA